MLLKDSRLAETKGLYTNQSAAHVSHMKRFNLFLTWKGHVLDFERLLFTLVLLHESSSSSWSCKTCCATSNWKPSQITLSKLDILRKVMCTQRFLLLWICSHPKARPTRAEGLPYYQFSKQSKLGCFSTVESTSLKLYNEDCHSIRNIWAAGSDKIQ